MKSIFKYKVSIILDVRNDHKYQRNIIYSKLIKSNAYLYHNAILIFTLASASSAITMKEYYLKMALKNY